MVQLKQVSLRLKSIKNIQKITKTMKMVSASKCSSTLIHKEGTFRFTRAERELRAARPFGYGPRKFYESSKLVEGEVDTKKDEEKKAAAAPAPAPEAPVPKDTDKAMKRVYIAVTSDRGLCGGVHSGVARRIRRELTEQKAEGATHKIMAIGDKSRGMLRRQFAPNMIISIKDIGRQTPVFADASRMAAALSDSGYVYDQGDIYYNKFFSAVKYQLSVIPFFNKDRIEAAPNMNSFDDVDADTLECFTEWTLAALLYYALKESAASEQSARMSAMDNATKNASEMIRKLTLLFNRTRQSVITRELIEIISGASALE